MLKKQLTLKDLKDEVAELYFSDTNPGYVGLCLAGESGELLAAVDSKELLTILLSAVISKNTGKVANFLKKMGRTGEFKEDKIKEIRGELPDIKFYIAVLENLLGIDPDEDWHRKMNHNERKYKRTIKPRPFTCDCGTCIK